MEVQVNWVAILAATVVSMVVGGFWYAPPVFGNEWMKLIGKKRKELPQGWMPIVSGVAAGAVTAYILAHFIYQAHQFYADRSFLSVALTTAFFAWFGLNLTRMFTHYSFEGRSHKLTIMNGAHELVTFLGMALVIGLFGV